MILIFLENRKFQFNYHLTNYLNRLLFQDFEVNHES